MKTSLIKKVISSVRHNMGPTIFLSAAHYVFNSNNEYHRRISLDSHSDTTVLCCDCFVLTYTGNYCKVSPYSDKYQSIQHVPVVTGATSWTCPHYGETFIVVFNEALFMVDKLDYTLVIPNQMCYHCIYVQDNPCMQKPMGITCPEEGVTITHYMSVTIFRADTLSPTQQQLEDCPFIVLTSPHDQDPHSIRFPKGSHSKEEKYLFASVAASRVDVFWGKFHETEFEPGLQDTIHYPSSIKTRLVSQVRIPDAKVPDTTRISDIDEVFFKVDSKTYPLTGPFRPKRDILMSIHMTSARYGRQ